MKRRRSIGTEGNTVEVKQKEHIKKSKKNKSTHIQYGDGKLCSAIDAIMAEELKVVLKRSEDASFGFSLLGTAGLPHVIYDIMENSPAAECGVVSHTILCFSL